MKKIKLKEKYGMSSLSDSTSIYKKYVNSKINYIETNKKQYYDILNSVRILRSECLQELQKNEDNSIWCCSKHLLSIFMRFTEVATKYLYNKKINEFEKYLKFAFDIYDLFFLLQRINTTKVCEKKVVNQSKKQVNNAKRVKEKNQSKKVKVEDKEITEEEKLFLEELAQI